MTLDVISALFVYGTLKTGQCRESCWPCDPLEVRKAWTGGELYDTGPYPAMFQGLDQVAGELWLFKPDEMALVLAELDQVEEYRPGCEETNLYNRLVIDCVDQHQRQTQAYTYFYGRERERQFFKRLLPTIFWGDQRFAVWPAGAEW